MTDLREEDFLGRTGDEILDYVKKQRWFGQKSLEPEHFGILDIIPMDDNRTFFLVIARIGFSEKRDAMYSLPMRISVVRDQDTMAQLYSDGKVRFVQDAFHDAEYARVLTLNMAYEKKFTGLHGSVVFHRTEFFSLPEFRTFATIRSEQSNSSSVVDSSMIMKNYRYLQDGENPDVEMAMALTLRTEFRNVPKPLGYAVYEGKGMKLYTTAVSEFLAGSTDGWTYYTGMFRSMIERMEDFQSFRKEIYGLGEELGELTGKMHESLSSVDDDSFRPESMEFSDLEETVRGSIEYITLSFDLLRPLSGKNREYTDRIEKISRKGYLQDVAAGMLSGISVSEMKRIRIHGDYHLGQILVWKDAFYIIDFEGEPLRSMTERRRKQSPMKDLAGIIRSMDYLVSHVVMETGNQRLTGEKDRLLKDLREIIIESYRKAFKGYWKILPGDHELFNLILDLYILDKSSYELLYEINNRPSWIEIPLIPVMSILESAGSRKDH